jgi:hypothetical protein
MLSHDLRIDASRIYPEAPRQVKPETQAVEVCPGAENALVPQNANHIGERVWRVGDDKDQRLRRHCVKLRNEALVNGGICVKQPQPARRVVPIGSAARLFVCAGRDHHQRGALEIGIVAGAQLGIRVQHGAVLDVGHQTFRPCPSSVHHNDFARATAGDQGRQTRGTNRARADYSYFHLTVFPCACDYCG